MIQTDRVLSLSIVIGNPGIRASGNSAGALRSSSSGGVFAVFVVTTTYSTLRACMRSMGIPGPASGSASTSISPIPILDRSAI